jgi:predicted ATPase
MAYKELPNSEYEVFVNINLLLKYSDTMDEKEKYDYRRQMKEWKERWVHGRKADEEKKIEEWVYDWDGESEVKK